MSGDEHGAATNPLTDASEDARSPLPAVFITLVHGTWGRGFFPPKPGSLPSRTRRWFEEGSDFRKALTQELNSRAGEGEDAFTYQIASFEWSGANSVRHRNTAGRRLAERLESQHRDHPSAVQFVIAHSHGGNVVIQALRYLMTIHDRLLIATIATPFLEIFTAATSEREKKAAKQLILSIGLLPILALNSLFMIDLARPGGTPVLLPMLKRLLGSDEDTLLTVNWIVIWVVIGLGLLLQAVTRNLMVRLNQNLAALCSTSSQHSLR